MNDSANRHINDKELLSKSLLYSFSLYARMFVKLLGGIVIAKLLGPALFGLKNAYDLAREYEMNSDLGTFDALNRLAPYYRGEKNDTKARNAISTVFSINLYYAVIAAATLAMVSLYLKRSGYEQIYVDFAFFLGIMIFTGKMHLFLQTKFKIEHRFYELSVNHVLYGFTASILCIVLVFFLGFRGLLTGLVITDIICIAHLMTKEKRIPEIKFSPVLYWQILKVGFPMMILFLMIILLSNADRTLILIMISEEALGYFGMATIATGIIATIPGAIHSVTLAPVMEKLGRTKNSQSIKHYLNEPMVIMAYILPVLISCIFFAIHLPIRHFLYQYTPSIPVVQILLIGIFFQSLSSPVLSVCLAINKQVQLIFLVLPMVVLNIVLNYAFIRGGWGINGVAAGTSISFFASYCILLYYASLQFEEGFKAYFDTLSTVLLPFIYAMALILLIERFMDFTANSIWIDLIATLCKIAVFTFCYSIMLYRIRKHSGFIKLYTNLRLLAGKFYPGVSGNDPG
jgi:O-antigen/teichoic acid export membrane protein